MAERTGTRRWRRRAWVVLVAVWALIVIGAEIERAMHTFAGSPGAWDVVRLVLTVPAVLVVARIALRWYRPGADRPPGAAPADPAARTDPAAPDTQALPDTELNR